jgi:hypothetical protein
MFLIPLTVEAINAARESTEREHGTGPMSGDP